MISAFFFGNSWLIILKKCMATPFFFVDLWIPIALAKIYFSA